MNECQCRNCQYYLQHFTLIKHKIIRVYCGHCTFARPKKKLPDAKACENYVPGSAPEDSFVSKEYLSRELLAYMLSLDLLPDIEG